MGNIKKKMRDNLEARRAAYDARLEAADGFHRPGSMKKKRKGQPGDIKGGGKRR